MSATIKLFHWTPRIICILAILFVSLFALDAFEPGLTLWQQIGAFLIHLIPSFILLAILVVAWKWENIGGIIFIIIGLALSPFVFNMNFKMTHSIWMSLGIILMITIPFVVVGILFLMSYNRKRKLLSKSHL